MPISRIFSLSGAGFSRRQAFIVDFLRGLFSCAVGAAEELALATEGPRSFLPIFSAACFRRAYQGCKKGEALAAEVRGLPTSAAKAEFRGHSQMHR